MISVLFNRKTNEHLIVSEIFESEDYMDQSFLTTENFLL